MNSDGITDIISGSLRSGYQYLASVNSTPNTISLLTQEDAELAEEMAEIIRLQILQQAGASVLRQANLNHQIVMDLLRLSLS